MLPRWPCCWSSRSRPTTSSLQSGRAVWIPVCRLHSDVTVSRAMELLWLTQRVQSQRDFKDSIIKTVCSVSSYKANCKEYTDKVIMDEGFSLPCYGTFHRKLWWSRQGKDLSLLCPLFQMGCCWICKCMVNRNSMMQNITYNPFGQDPFLPFFFSFFFLFAFDCHNFHHSYWCWSYRFPLLRFTKKFTSEVTLISSKVGSLFVNSQKCTLFSTCGNWVFRRLCQQLCITGEYESGQIMQFICNSSR